jgi:mitochondrial-processing peptidase subunit beta
VSFLSFFFFLFNQVLMEHLHDAAFLDTQMGMSVMGTPETVGMLSAANVAGFAADHVTAKRTVVAASGAIDAGFAKLVEDSFKNISTTGGSSTTMSKAHFTGSDKRMRFDSKPVAHVAVAFQGVSHASPDAVPLALLGAYLGEIDNLNNNALLAKNATSWLKSDQAPNHGSPGAGGPITLKIINESYKDSGLFGIYYTAFDNNLEEAMYFNMYNLVRLVHHATEEDVNFAKTQLKASLAAKLNTNSGLANDLAKSISTKGNAVSMSEMFAAIDGVSLSTFKAVADRVINDKDHALAAAGPIHELPDYNWIRRRSYWLRY